jgi:hypothetical protein
MKRFWLWLCRFAYRRVASPLGTAPDGLPHIRDTDSRCDAYEPRPRQPGDFYDCGGDGHYLCKECCHYVNLYQQEEE